MVCASSDQSQAEPAAFPQIGLFLPFEAPTLRQKDSRQQQHTRLLFKVSPDTERHRVNMWLNEAFREAGERFSLIVQRLGKGGGRLFF